MMAEKPGAAVGTTATSPQITPLRKAPLFTAREVWWSMFAAISLAYLGVRAIAPDWLEDLTPANGAIAEQADIQAQRIAQRLSGEVRNLQSSVQQLQLDVAKVKTELAGEAEQSRVLSTKVSALEQKTVVALQRTEAAAHKPEGAIQQSPGGMVAEGILEPASAQAQAPKLMAAPSPITNPIDPAAAIAAAFPIATTELPAPQPTAAAPAQHKIINATTAVVPNKPAAPAIAKPIAGAQPAKALETGSVAESPEIAFGPAIVKRAAKPIGLQISSSTSIDSLRQSWESLTQNHAAALQNMQPLYVAKGPATNQTFDLVAGPVKSKAEAIKLCKSLAAKNIACKVGAFEGSAF